MFALARCITMLAVFTLGCTVFAAKPKAYPDPIYESDEPEARKNAKTLPVLEEGPGKGYFAYYEHDHYNAYVDKTGALFIELKDDSGTVINDKWQIIPGIDTHWRKIIGFNNRNKPRRKGFVRYIKEIEEADGGPSDRPREISIEVELMDGTEFVRKYDFDREEIMVRTGFEDDRKIEDEHKSWYRLTTGFPACMKFAPSVEQPEREEALEGYEVEFETAGGSSETYSYAKSDDLPNRVEKVHARGPWKEREIIIETDDPIMHPWKYKGKCPYEGYRLRINVPDDSTTYGKQIEQKIIIG